jgi:hypothetical protein
VTGTDTDTGVYYPAANQVALATNGTQRLLLDSSGNVLINSTTLPAPLATNFRNIFVKGDSNGVVTVSSNDQLCSVSMYSGANSTDVPSMLFQNGLRFGLTTDLGTGGYAEKMRVNTYGIGVGGAVPSSGIGITFPATQSASSDANTLDDYEEGTFTPNLITSTGTPTYQFRTGQYTKVGRMVTVGGIIGITNSTSLTGVIAISLPFPASAQADGIACGIGADAAGFSWPVAAGGGNTYYATWVTFQGASQMNMTTLTGVINYNSTGVSANWYMRYSATYQAS